MAANEMTNTALICIYDAYMMHQIFEDKLTSAVTSSSSTLKRGWLVSRSDVISPSSSWTKTNVKPIELQPD